MALELVPRLRRPLALVAAALFLFGSAGKAIAGVECHRDAEGSHHSAHGAHHAADDESREGSHEQGAGNAPCECLDTCQYSSYAAAESAPGEPVHLETTGEPAVYAASSLVIRPQYFLPYPNGPPTG